MADTDRRSKGQARSDPQMEWEMDMKSMRRVLFAAFLGASAPAWSHGDPPAPRQQPAAISSEEHSFGRQGDPAKATRTIRIDMADTMRYSPSEITVKQGETIRFEVKNGGKVMHEIVFGSMQDLRAHAALMRKHPGMEHDEPYMAHVGPGRSERLVWQFTRPGEVYYGCLVAGHFEAGMVGKVVVK